MKSKMRARSTNKSKIVGYTVSFHARGNITMDISSNDAMLFPQRLAFFRWIPYKISGRCRRRRGTTYCVPIENRSVLRPKQSKTQKQKHWILVNLHQLQSNIEIWMLVDNLLYHFRGECLCYRNSYAHLLGDTFLREKTSP